MTEAHQFISKHVYTLFLEKVQSFNSILFSLKEMVGLVTQLEVL